MVNINCASICLFTGVHPVFVNCKKGRHMRKTRVTNRNNFLRNEKKKFMEK